MSTEAKVRLQVELELLLAMYPDSISFSPKSQELKYTHDGSDTSSGAPKLNPPTATLVLRLPETYPSDGLPEVISATGLRKEDLRSGCQEKFRNLDVSTGEEILDALLLSFQELIVDSSSDHLIARESGERNSDQVEGKIFSTSSYLRAGSARGDTATHTEKSKTVIIWLHHLLNTNKRKLTLNPTLSSSSSSTSSAHKISGITKPGYPGVLVFSGPKSLVDDHVSELKYQRWQAFQVRYDSEDHQGKENDPWHFNHGSGIREAESMGDVAQDITDSDHREIFLSVIGVK